MSIRRGPEITIRLAALAAPAQWVAAHAGPLHELSLVRERPWGRIYRYGELWFKINGGGTTYEPALLDLVKGRPLTPVVVATEPSRGWTLLADAGRSMREIGGSDDEVVERWLDVLPRYARLQRSFVGSADVALGAGVPDHSSPSLLAGLGRLAPLSSRAEELLALDLTPLGETLDTSGIPATVEHGDLHDANVFVDAGGRVSVIDWGDAAIGHPFMSLQAVKWLGTGLNWEPDDHRLDAIRDVYLAEWGDPRALRPVADAAVRLACVGRALSWSRALRDVSSEVHAQWDHPVTAWLEELLPPAP